jgi:hypothetical protein
MSTAAEEAQRSANLRQPEPEPEDEVDYPDPNEVSEEE